MDIQWPLAIFSTLAGCGGILLAFVGVAELTGRAQKSRFASALTAMILLIVGGCASVAHLAQKANIMAAAANIFSFSSISLELIFLGINVVIAIVYLIIVKREASAAAAKVVSAIGICTGVIMAFVVGSGYVMESQQYWNTVTLPLSYLGSGLACGSILFAAIMHACKEDVSEVKFMASIALACVVIELATFLAYAAATGFVLDALWFWVLAVCVGCVVSGVLCWLGIKSKGALYGAAACALVGGLGLRAAMFLVGYGFLDFFALAGARTILGL